MPSSILTNADHNGRTNSSIMAEAVLFLCSPKMMEPMCREFLHDFRKSSKDCEA